MGPRAGCCGRRARRWLQRVKASSVASGAPRRCHRGLRPSGLRSGAAGSAGGGGRRCGACDGRFYVVESWRFPILLRVLSTAVRFRVWSFLGVEVEGREVISGGLRRGAVAALCWEGGERSPDEKGRAGHEGQAGQGAGNGLPREAHAAGGALLAMPADLGHEAGAFGVRERWHSGVAAVGHSPVVQDV